MNSLDLQELKKALDLASVGSILHEPVIDRTIRELIEVNNPLRQNLPRKPGGGQGYQLKQRTGRGLAEFVIDTDNPASSNSSYADALFPWTTILQPGKVTRRVQAQGKSLLDIQAEEIESSVQAVRDAEENALINGNKTTNPKEFDGLRTLIPAGQVIDAAGGSLTLDLLDQAIDLVIGMPKMILLSKKAARRLNALLQAQQQFQNQTTVNGGFRLATYSDIPLFKSIYVADNQGGGSETDIFIIDTEDVFVGELTPLKFENLSKTSSQFTEFHVFEDVTLVLGNPLKASRLANVSLA